MIGGISNDSKKMIVTGVIFILVTAIFINSISIFLIEGNTKFLKINGIVNEDSEYLTDGSTITTNIDRINVSSNSRTGLSYANGGKPEWNFKAGNEEVSTPALCDLNPPFGSQGDLEVVIASASDAIYAIKSDGQPHWTNPFTDCTIDTADILAAGLDYEPPPFFSSIKPVDIAGSNAPELLVCEKNGILCLNPDGTKHWSGKGSTQGYYFSTVGVTDLEGDFAGIDENGQYVGYRDDLELIVGSDYQSNSNGCLEAWKAGGGLVFTLNLSVPCDHAFMTNGIVCTEMDGYFQMPYGPPEEVKQNNPETLMQDILTATHGFPGRITKHKTGGLYGDYQEYAKVDDANWGNQETYGTAAVGNFAIGNGNPVSELEAYVGFSDGPKPWTDAQGMFLAYDQTGLILTPEFTPSSTPSGFHSSPAVADVQCVDEKDLPEGQKITYEVFVGCDNGYIYCLDAETLNELWSYETGGRILSSPAICNIYSDDMLEVIIGSDDGFVYCFEGDPMELDINGEPHPNDDGVPDAGGDTGEYDLLWRYNTGGSGIGISSPVVADIDNDKDLEVVIGDKDGWIYCINAGGDCIPGQIDWPMFHCELNNTGFYKPQVTYGVDISKGLRYLNGDWYPEILEKQIAPRASVTYNLTVTNTGTSALIGNTDDFYFNASVMVYQNGKMVTDPVTGKPVSKGWQYEITGNDLMYHEDLDLYYVTLQNGQYTNIQLVVYGPYDGEIGEFAQITVEVNSGTDKWARDSITTTTNLELNPNFEVVWDVAPWLEDPEDPRYGQKYIEIMPGAEAKVKVRIENIGNVNDTYDLELSDLIETWHASFTDEYLPNFTISLDAKIFKDTDNWLGSEARIDVKIILPSEAQPGDIANIRLTGISQYCNKTPLVDELIREDILAVCAQLEPDIELTCDDPLKYVNPDDNVTFVVNVKNNCNTEIDVVIEHSYNSIASWEVAHIGEISVFPQSKQSVNVEVTAPIDALADAKLIVTLKGSVIDDGIVKLCDRLALVAIIPGGHPDLIEVKASPYSRTVEPGEFAEYTITVDNKGHTDAFIKVTPFVIKPGWSDVAFILENDSFYNAFEAPIEYQDNLTFILRLAIPIDELANTYETTLNITNRDWMVLLNLETIVNQTYELVILGYDNSRDEFSNEINKSVSPGWKVDFIFKVSNNGNAPQTVLLNLDGLKNVASEKHWKGYFFTVANTLSYTTNIKSIDFTQEIHMLNQQEDLTYINRNDTEISEIKIKLGSFQEVYVEVRIIVPTEVVDGQYKFITLEGISENPEREFLGDNLVKINLEILYSDLAIQEITHPNYIKNGDIVNLSVSILNIGDIEARDIDVVMYIDGMEINSVCISYIANDGDKILITFYWQAVSGKHELKFAIDPNNTIIEKNDQFLGLNNNEIIKILIIDDGKKNIDGTNGDLFKELAVHPLNIIILIIIGIIVVLLILLWKKQEWLKSKFKKEEVDNNRDEYLRQDIESEDLK